MWIYQFNCSANVNATVLLCELGEHNKGLSRIDREEIEHRIKRAKASTDSKSPGATEPSGLGAKLINADIRRFSGIPCDSQQDGDWVVFCLVFFFIVYAFSFTACAPVRGFASALRADPLPGP